MMNLPKKRPNEFTRGIHSIWFIVIAAVAIILAVGASFYAWQKPTTVASEEVYTENPINDARTSASSELNQSPFSDEEILAAVYSDYRYPEGFFTEDFTYPRGEDFFDGVSYIDEFINNEKIFFCTDNPAVARQRIEEEITIFNRAIGYTARTIIEENQNEKLFEFILLSKVHDTIHDTMYYPYNDYYPNYRVQKCGYLSYLKSTYLYTSPIIGIYALRPVTRENVKELTEYLWYSVYGGYDNKGSKILRSTTEDIVDSIKHTVFQTEVDKDNATGEWCDFISVAKLTYIVNKNSGVIELYEQPAEPTKGRCEPTL